MAITTQADLSNFATTTAYDLYAWGALRPELCFDQFATVKATNQSHNGATVRFGFVGDLAPSTTPLSETVDTTPTTLTQSYVDITMQEYGAAVTTTGLVRGTSYVPVDPVAAERTGYNAGLTIDTLIQDTLAGGSNTTDITSETENTLSSDLLRRTDAALVGRNVRTLKGSKYVLVIHPEQEYDLRSETDAAGWRYFQAHSGNAGEGVYTGQIGTYEHFHVITNNRVKTTGTGATKSYNAYAIGAEAIAKAHSKMPGYGAYPRVGPGPVVDIHRRFVPVQWYWLGGYGIFREEALQVLTTRSGINS